MLKTKRFVTVLKGIMSYLRKADQFEPSQARLGASLELVVLGIADCVAEIDEKLSQTALGGSIISKHIGKCGVAQWFRKTLSQRLTSSIVVTQTRLRVSHQSNLGRDHQLTGGSI